METNHEHKKILNYRKWCDEQVKEYTLINNSNMFNSFYDIILKKTWINYDQNF